MKKQCKGSPFCNSLDPDTRDFLCEHSTLIYQMPKQSQTPDQENDHLEIIVEGVLFTFTLLEDGSQEFIDLIKIGDVLGTRLLVEKLSTTPYNLMTLTKVKKCIIPIKIAEKLYHENKQFSQALVENLLSMMNTLTQWVIMRAKNGTEKVKYIYELLQNLGIDMNSITQDDLALITGVSRMTVARAMKDIFKK